MSCTTTRRCSATHQSDFRQICLAAHVFRASQATVAAWVQIEYAVCPSAVCFVRVLLVADWLLTSRGSCAPFLSIRQARREISSVKISTSNSLENAPVVVLISADAMAQRTTVRTTYDIERTLQPIYSGGSIALSEDGRILAACLGEDALLTDVTTGKELGRIEGDGEPITALICKARHAAGKLGN